MPTLEQVCQRLFSGQSWILKCLLGALLMIVPIAHFCAFGYLYEVIEKGRRGESLELPDWDDWRRLFGHGIPAFVIFAVFALAPLAIAWVLTWPLRPLNLGMFVYLPLVPVVLLAAPMAAAGIYQYQKREDYRDAFRVYVLLAMLRATKARFYVPTFALLGLLVAFYPIAPFALFTGLAASWAFYAVFFRAVEDSRKNSHRVS